MTETKTLNFKVSGEFLTQHARDRMFDRGWEDAVRFLVTSLHGFTYDYAIQLLKGEMRLIGENHVEFVNEEESVKNELTTRLNYAFAGIIFDGTHYWHPYAYIDNYGPDDIGFKPRQSFYMDDKKQDIAIALDYCRPGDKFKTAVQVLWKKIPAPPVWIDIRLTTSYEDAFNEYLTIGKKDLDSRGHFQNHKNEIENCRFQLDNIFTHPTVDDVFTETSEKIEDIKESYDIKKIGRESYDVPIEDKEFFRESGWILPNGKFYGCLPEGHYKLADDILYSIREVGSPNAEKDAEYLGWIKISVYKNEPLIVFDDKVTPTADQVLSVQEWCLKHGHKLPSFFKEYIKSN